MIYLFGLIAMCVVTWLYTIVAYDKWFVDKPVLSYFVANLGGIISISTWMFLIRQLKDDKYILIVNVVWDVGITLMVILFPIFLFNVKIDLKTAIGCTLAVLGIIIAKV